MQQIEDDRQRLLVGDLIRRRSGLKPSRFLVMRPWPMPSVIEVPSAFSSPVRVVAVERGAERIGERDLDVRVALLQRDADAGERAAGADRADEAVDLAVGLLPDLRAGGPIVGLRGWRHCRTGWPRSRRSAPCAASSFGQAAGDVHVVVRVLVGHRRHLDQLRAAEAEHVLLLLDCVSGMTITVR